MEMGLQQGQRIEVRQSQELRVEQRLLIEQRLETRILTVTALIQAVRGERYEPKARCPKCIHKMTTVEIMRGFRRDPNDFTTRCPKCKTRFEAQLVCSTAAARVELPFYCSMQIMDRLRGLQHLKPDEMLVRNAAVYRSAIFHFGGLGKAFTKINIEYRYAETAKDWMIKVEGFLGQAPDTLIASVAGVSVRKVSALRRARGIAAFRG